MHELYELKEMLCEELKEYGKKGEMSAGSLEIVDKLAHAIKNLDKIIETYEEEEYSGRGSYEGGSMRGSYEDGRRGSYRGSYEDGRSYERGSYARGRGRNARRDSRGRYSSEGYSRNEDMAMQIREMMEDAPDERTRQEFQRFLGKLENM